MHKKRVRKAAANRLCFALTISLLTLMCGCDGGIHIKGKVYAKKSANGEPAVFVDEAHSIDSDLIPLADATVTLFGHKDYSKAQPDRAKDESIDVKTGKDGSFELGHLTSPFRYRAALIVEKDGYKPVTKIFLKDKSEQEAVIILVPTEKPIEQNSTK